MKTLCFEQQWRDRHRKVTQLRCEKKRAIFSVWDKIGMKCKCCWRYLSFSELLVIRKCNHFKCWQLMQQPAVKAQSSFRVTPGKIQMPCSNDVKVKSSGKIVYSTVCLLVFYFIWEIDFFPIHLHTLKHTRTHTATVLTRAGWSINSFFHLRFWISMIENKIMEITAPHFILHVINQRTLPFLYVKA